MSQTLLPDALSSPHAKEARTTTTDFPVLRSKEGSEGCGVLAKVAQLAVGRPKLRHQAESYIQLLVFPLVFSDCRHHTPAPAWPWNLAEHTDSQLTPDGEVALDGSQGIPMLPSICEPGSPPPCSVEMACLCLTHAKGLGLVLWLLKKIEA